MLKPLSADRWNFTTAAHLLNRAGFGGPPAAIEKLVQLGPDKAVASFVDYQKVSDPAPKPDWAAPEGDRVDRYLAVQRMGRLPDSATDEERQEMERKRRQMFQEERREQQRRLMELRGWWLERMAGTSRPLQEKLTLFWHGHFATSAVKVREAYYMWLQNETFRQLASGNWVELLASIAKDPAMLIWLDQAQSRKQAPNENFARELMELFSLGEGHYTEKDVTEAARAFTGFTLNRAKQRYEYRPSLHDGGVKTVLGKTGNLTGTDVIAQIVAQPQAARFICGKLWTFFAEENPSPKLVEALATVFRRGGNNFNVVLRAMFRSEEFYAGNVIRSQVKSPVQWLVGSCRVLERELPPAPATAMLLRLLGQELFAPPNVKGWDGGISWITTNNLLSRYNASAFLVFSQIDPAQMNRAGRGAVDFARQRRGTPVNVTPLLEPEARRNKETLIAALEKRFLQGQLKEKQRQVLRECLEAREELSDDDVRNTIRLLMCTPEYQLT